MDVSKLSEMKQNDDIMDVSDLKTMKQYSRHEINTIPRPTYKIMTEISNKVENGWKGKVEMVAYLILSLMFIIMLVSNNAVDQDITLTKLPAPTYKSNFQVICIIGLILCMVRLSWSSLFVKPTRYNKIIQLVFNIIIFSLFISSLMMSLKTNSELEKLGVVPNTHPLYPSQESIKQGQTQVTIASITGIAITSIYSIYNVFTLFQADEITE